MHNLAVIETVHTQSVDLYKHSDIIERCKNGERRAQYEIYRLYSKSMFNVAFRIVNRFEEAEDILQDVFVQAFSKLTQFKYESTFGAWLKRITINHCINHLRKRKVVLMFPEELPTDTVFESNEKTNDFAIEDLDRIRRAMAKLPDGFRIVLSLYLLDGYDHSEISQILGITESTSKSQFKRAKDKLKQIIDHERK